MSFCLLMYNALQVARHLASYQACEAKKISNEKLFYDVKRQMVAVSEFVEVDSLLALLGEVPTAAELRECMRRDCQRVERSLVESTQLRPWWASEGEERVLGNHTSTHRVLEQTRKQKHQAPTATQRP